MVQFHPLGTGRRPRIAACVWGSLRDRQAKPVNVSDSIRGFVAPQSLE
jgi:hypothetical protein